MALSSEQIKDFLDERRGPIERFSIDFRPRVNIFRVIPEETVISMLHGATGLFGEWEIESIAFLPIGGNPHGFRVILRRTPPLFASAAIGITPLAAAVVIIAVVGFVFVAVDVTNLGESFLDKAPGAVGDVAEGLKIGALGLLVAATAGFFYLVRSKA